MPNNTRDNRMPDPLRRLVIAGSRDRDPRVRRHVLVTLQRYCRHGGTMDREVYGCCMAILLHDEDEHARLAATSTLRLLTMGTAKSTLAATTRDKLFSALCEAVNDAAAAVRAQICQLLGYFSDVDERLLEQSLRKTPLHPRQQLPLSVSAYGAFVHGLEDEYEQVRRAAIDSIYRLATRSHRFAAQSVGALLDMVNDENDGVRIRAIRAVQSISARYGLAMSTDRIRTCLGLLDDPDRKVRLATYAMLRFSRFESLADAIPGFIADLLQKLNHWPEDRLVACRMFSDIGKAHPDQIADKRDQLLGHVQGTAYKTKKLCNVESLSIASEIFLLCLIFNAATRAPTILSGLPEQLFRQYALIRDTHPHCMPPVSELPSDTVQPAALALEQRLHILRDCQLAGYTTFNKQLQSLVEAVLQTLRKCHFRAAERKMALLSRVYVGEQNASNQSSPRVERPTDSYALFCQYIHQLLHTIIQLYYSAMTGSDSGRLGAFAVQLLHTSIALEHQFYGICPSLKAFLRRARLTGLTVCQACIVDIPSSTSRSHDETPSSAHRTLQGGYSMNDKSIVQVFEKILLDMPTFQLAGVVRKRTATITKPKRNHASPAQFIAHFPCSIAVQATLDVCYSVEDILLHITLPDGTTLHFWPHIEHFVAVGPSRYVLDTTVLLRITPWTAANKIEMRIASRVHIDATAAELAMIRHIAAEPAAPILLLPMSSTSPLPQPAVFLSDAAHFYLWPRATLRPV